MKIKSFLKNVTCDTCNRLFKHGLKVDLMVHRVHVRGGEIDWSPDDDVEYLAYFCNKKCMNIFLADCYKEETK